MAVLLLLHHKRIGCRPRKSSRLASQVNDDQYPSVGLVDWTYPSNKPCHTVLLLYFVVRRIKGLL